MTDEDEFRIPFRIDVARLTFYGNFNCLGRLIGLCLREAREVIFESNSPIDTGNTYWIFLKAAKEQPENVSYSLVSANCGFFENNKFNKVCEIFLVYDHEKNSVMPKCGENLEGVTAAARIWNPEIENYNNDD